jgi:hypothetical protein
MHSACMHKVKKKGINTYIYMNIKKKTYKEIAEDVSFLWTLAHKKSTHFFVHGTWIVLLPLSLIVKLSISAVSIVPCYLDWTP